MSDSQRGQGQPKGLPAWTATRTAKEGARKKTRTTYSCLNCHRRKVKCDRVKPCSACCLRGTPSECEYGTSKRDHHYIQQSALIDSLMKTCEDLKKQLAEARALANLPPVKPEEPFSVSSPEDHREKTVDEERSQNPESRASSSLIKQSADPAGRSFAQTTNTPCTTDRSSRSLSDDKRILTDPAVASSFVEVFVERLIDNFSPQPASVYGGTVALREASRMRILSPMLCTAFEAASLTFAGRREQIREVEAVGHARYVRVLRQLQTALNDPKQNKSTEVMVVVLLFTIIEAFKHSTKDSLLKHQLGGLQLLQARTPYRHRYGIDRSLYVDLRLYWDTVRTGLGYRGARPEQTHLPREQGVADRPVAGRRSIQGHPPPTAGHRGRHPRVPRADRPLHRGPPQRHRALDRARRAADGPLGPRDGTAARLNRWKTMFADTYPPGQAWEEPAADTATRPESDPQTTFPTFLYRDPATMRLRPAPLLVYPDLLSATCMTFYWALHLTLSTADGGLGSVLGLQERYQYACNICRSMKYYVENTPGGLVSRIMFVLRTAFDAFADWMVEKAFVTEVFRHIADKFHFSVFANQCASFSVSG
ncbi:hypothetical protein KXW39_001909 [Aspergillus fumigatus]|nr:hypothetical protein KXW39_001909 [Aspergillus fumigatus]